MVGTPYFLKKTRKKIPTNAQKCEKTFSIFFSFFHTLTNTQGFGYNQIGPIQIFKEYSYAFPIKNSAKILINTKVIKVLLTGGVNPM